MCGIFCTNIITDVKVIDEQSKHAEKRGPDSAKNIIVDGILFVGHRLKVNGLSDKGDQPITRNNVHLLCNGEIYNHKYLWQFVDDKPETDSDCEVIIPLYKKYGIHYTLQLLDGVFAIILYDSDEKLLFTARDPMGVRPLLVAQHNAGFAFASELKQLVNFGKIIHFNPGIYIVMKNGAMRNFNYYNMDLTVKIREDYHVDIYNTLKESVKKRLKNTQLKIGCLLSGGLDSSIVTAFVAKYIKNLDTFSVGLKDSPDIINARKVSKHLGTNHHELILEEKDFLSAIPEVIRVVESYDTTTVRASVGNYLIAKYIKENTKCKVIFSGDGADEVMGGYLYLKNCPHEIEFDRECRKLIQSLYFFDIQRSDRCISGNGLEPRLPYLDKNFVQSYLSIPPGVRFTQTEKEIMRESIKKCCPDLLPDSIINRTKEAFSDGISKTSRSWYKIIEEHLSGYTKNEMYKFNIPRTNEQKYYRDTFEKEYPGQAHLIPYFWMPRFSETDDPSARTLKEEEEIVV